MAYDQYRPGNLPLGNGIIDNGVENGEAGIKRSLAESCSGKKKDERQKNFR